jgi:UDP-N-acetyl-D-galactosamine dehydrogenase
LPLWQAVTTIIRILAIGALLVHEYLEKQLRAARVRVFKNIKTPTMRLGVIGLGYVGLPLAVELGKHYETVGFDISGARVAELKRGRDGTLEMTTEELRAAKHLSFTTAINALKRCNFYIVTVPTPIDQYKQPNLAPLISASETVGRVLSRGDIVSYESTVYPGCTEEICCPILERVSGLKLNRDFCVGYSPERINPGDKEHRLTNICKITSGSTPAAAIVIDRLYASIVRAGTYRASSIRVAEAAKVIENTQRDVNIALINELALLFHRLGIDTEEVLKAAGTKWNFLAFRPGLVGGHCIGVDPYYLTHKAQEIGHHSEMILAGRRMNDQMGLYVAGEVVKLLTEKRLPVKGARVLVMGLTFKENCSDIRNSRVVDVVRELERYGVKVDVFDPWVNARVAHGEYQVRMVRKPRERFYEAIILAVPHRAFREMGLQRIRRFNRRRGVVYDVKYLFDRNLTDGRL